MLGGLPDISNIVPQARSVNRGIGSIWANLERLMARFLRREQPGGVGGYIIWRVICSYANDIDLRPQQFWISAEFYDLSGNQINDGLYNAQEHVINNRN